MRKSKLDKTLKLIKPNRIVDSRGFFAETYSRQKYFELEIDAEFVQDNHSISNEVGTLRGLHFQSPPHAQAKLVRCGHGVLFDVAVDIRQGSPTYGDWAGYELSAENGYQLYIPKGFAHGFITLEPNTEVIYKCSDYYSPKSEGSIRWNDKDIDIQWIYKDNPTISEKDAIAPLFKDFESPFTFGLNA